MRFEVGVIQHPPEGRAAHRWSRGLVVACDYQIIHTPARRWAVRLRRFLGREDRHRLVHRGEKRRGLPERGAS